MHRNENKVDNCIIVGPEIIRFGGFGKTNIFIPTGREINWNVFSGKLSKSKLNTVGGNIRKNLQRMDYGITAQENTYYILGAVMGRDKILPLGMPSSTDDQWNLIEQEDMDRARELAASCDKLIVFPSRKSWGLQSKGYHKGSEKFVYSYKKWMESKTHVGHRVICPIHGYKANEFRDNLEANIPLDSWILYQGNLSRSFLYALFAQENAILIDQFHEIGRSCVNGATREALALGTPVISNLDIYGDLFRTAYGPECPIFKASTVDDIVEALDTVAQLSSEEIQAHREKVKAWHAAFLAPEPWVERLRQCLC